MNDIIANYKNSKVLDLTGAIFEYDLNYFFLNGEKVEQGKRTGQFSKLRNLNKARTQSNLKTNDFESGPLDPNVCYELYWCSYVDGVLVNATFIGYSNACYVGGNDSGYDSASAYQGGGGPYSGNDAPPDYAITSDVTFSENEDQYTDADGSVNSSPERISYTYHYTISRLQSTREVISVMVYPATASPMVSYYIDSYNRDVTRSLTLLNQSNNYQINGTSVYINWYLSVNMRYTYTDGISPVFTRQRDKSQSTVEY
jgi:hypothetical protein